jgi:hypothetical protein
MQTISHFLITLGVMIKGYLHDRIIIKDYKNNNLYSKVSRQAKLRPACHDVSLNAAVPCGNYRYFDGVAYVCAKSY